jgi:hypothetical protein
MDPAMPEDAMHFPKGAIIVKAAGSNTASSASRRQTASALREEPLRSNSHFWF